MSDDRDRPLTLADGSELLEQQVSDMVLGFRFEESVTGLPTYTASIIQAVREQVAREGRWSRAERRTVLKVFQEGIHERLCGTPPSCGQTWRSCQAAGISQADYAAGMNALANEGIFSMKWGVS